MLLFMAADAGRRGYSLMLDAFWDEAGRSGIDLGQDAPVSAAAFCKARRKLKPDLLAALLAMVASVLRDKHSDTLQWNGRRIFAVDGVRHNLQRSVELAEHFGVPHGGHCPQMLASVLYDVVGKFPVAATIAPGSSCERQELLRLLPNLRRGDVLVLDRGYPSFEVLHALREAGIDFVIRVPKSGSFEAVQAFQQSSGNDYVMVVPPSAAAARNGAKLMEVRCVRIDVGADDPWLLFTTLRRADATLPQLRTLYHLRWEIEEFYKLLKSDHFSLRQMHAKSALGIQQEFLAQLVLAAMSRLLMANAAAEHKVNHPDLSPKAGILTLADGIVRLMLCDDPEQRLHHHADLLRRLARRRLKRRPGRSCPRRSFKPGPRWNSKGKIGG
jgi:Transposase DDE domain